MKTTASNPDIQIENHGSIILFRPLTVMAREWLQENTNAEAWQWFGGALAVEPRIADDLASALAESGLEVA